MIQFLDRVLPHLTPGAPIHVSALHRRPRKFAPCLMADTYRPPYIPIPDGIRRANATHTALIGSQPEMRVLGFNPR